MPVQTRSQSLSKMVSHKPQEHKYNRTLRSHAKKYRIILKQDGIMTRSQTKFMREFQGLH